MKPGSDPGFQTREARDIFSSPDPVRLLHITDPHLFADPQSSLRGTVTHASLSAVLAHIRDSRWPADLVAMTGDLIQDDSPGAYQRFIELLAPLGLPVYSVPGNHDVRALMQQALASPPFHYCATLEIGNWLIVGIDSCIDDEAGGHVATQELERLDGIIGTSAAAHIAVCLHHPPLPVGSAWLDRVGLANSDEFLDTICRSGRVRAVLFGHVHQAVDEELRSVRIIGTPSTCRQFMQGSDEFALDDNPPAYRRVTLHAHGGVDTELIWLAADQG